MPVPLLSRHADLAPIADADGVAALPIRRHAPLPPSAPRTTHLVTGAETLETLAFRYFGRNDDWWRIADANPLRFPLDWQPGDVLTVAAPAAPGRVTRDRRF